MTKKLVVFGVAAILLTGVAAYAGDIFDAAKSGDVAAIEKAGASQINAKDTATLPVTVTIGKEWTPLHWAAFGGHAKAVAALIAKGADVNAKDAFGYTPLHFAGNGECAAILLKHGAKVASRSSANGWTALHRAAFSSNKEVAQQLIAEGADVNAKDKLGNPALYYAAGFANSKEVASILIAKGADVNATDRFGWTPLHYAAYSGSLDMVKLLISKGAKVDAEDDYGKSALDQAKSAGRSDVVKYLESLKK